MQPDQPNNPFTSRAGLVGLDAGYQLCPTCAASILYTYVDLETTSYECFHSSCHNFVHLVYSVYIFFGLYVIDTS